MIDLSKPIFILAPMDGVTDYPFRQIINHCYSPDLYFTEFVNVDGLMSKGRDKLKSKLDHPKNEKNLIAQIWGLNPVNFFEISKQIVKKEFGSFVGIDLNMGCPDKTITKNGACSALINNRELAREIILKTQEGINEQLLFSIKTRLGYNEIDYSWIEFLLGFKPDILTVHLRTKKEMSKVPAHYEALKTILKIKNKTSPQTKIIANGDIKNREYGLKIIQKYKVDGVMIGRGVFDDPFAFAQKSPWEQYSRQQKIDLFKKHILLFKKTFQDEKPVQLLNKFCKIYINNFDHAKEKREELMSSTSINDLLLKLMI